ncbi:c2h2 type zinc finger domain-containing protein [Colletotrichum incanum]|uniref:C2h2 type zinc finger domain-containing protein n=1 Tax=Colletotrichum incanum TaxID=1573173 RepID=A0A166QZ60_COLIC|nr:c2h2 type zinc finger domain-containing protein [Colletotrichum incanum]OHW93867.1 C2H2 type zinc finger domain-containing protein [Colletotrichum incanum]
MADHVAVQIAPELPNDTDFDFSQFCVFPSGQSDGGMESPSSSVSGGAPLSDNSDNDNPDSVAPGDTNTPVANVPPKVGSRFTSAAVRVLRTWFDNHERHPYPTPKDLERLQKQTGLSKQQLVNWFANTRRRRRFRLNGATPPQIPSWAESTSGPTDIPARRPTPMPFEQMNPLQRWEHSPPENEPALVSDISRAVAASTRRSGHSSRSRSSARSSENLSSISSLGTSQSSRGSKSDGSAYSYGSNKSPSPLNGIRKDSSRRRRRATTKIQRGKPISLMQTRNAYQCTFCAETFKTKYDWQRHEKTLHLSLEEWICSPQGSTDIDPEKGVICVYCEEVDPDQDHLDSHHQAACLDRSLGERTFYRKDHLRQHLKLVHRTKQMTKCAERWKITTDSVHSRCGFCNLTFESWTCRGDHIAEHYRNDGKTMSDWKGDWGFEPSVLSKLDNAVPPYLIQWEQSAPVPFCAGTGPADTTPSAYELLKLELEYFVRNFFEANETLPSDDDLVYEGCSIIFGSQFFSPDLEITASSWLRDLFMSSTEIAAKARLRPMNQLAKLRMSQLKIKGKADIFEDCELESQLCRYLGEQMSLGLAFPDADLQQEACATLYRIESSSTNPSRRFAGFLVRLIWGSTDWIVPLRQRAEQFIGDSCFGFGLNQTTLEALANDQLNEFYGGLAELGQLNVESDKLLAYTGGGEKTNIEVRMASSLPPATYSKPAGPETPNGYFVDDISTAPQDFYSRLQTSKTLFAGSGFSLRWSEQPRGKGMPFFLNDPNRYARLARELSRFVASTMSPNNPNKHVPTDEEIRYQARWMLYDDDDPWNQTPADIAEWLSDFKKQVGLQ